jgi:hypothetical protein
MTIPKPRLAATAAALFPALVAAVLAAACVAAAAQAPGRGVMTMTRGVKAFGDAEAELVEVMKSRDAGAIDRLVGIEFEQRGSSAPAMPVWRGDWIDQAPAEFAHSAGTRDMAVHEFGDVAVVSFTWLRDRPQLPAFVVDVWRRKAEGEPYQLASRYLSPLPASARKAPAKADTKR